MPSSKKPAKAKKPARPQFGDWDAPRVTALLVLADGTVIEGFGVGAEGGDGREGQAASGGGRGLGRHREEGVVGIVAGRRRRRRRH